MKRLIATALVLAISALTVAPTFADETDLRSSTGVKNFWEQHQPQGAEGGGGGGN